MVIRFLNICAILSSAILLVYVLPELADDIVLKGVYFGLAISVDLFRQYILMLAKETISWLSFAVYLVVYALITLVVLALTVSFALAVVDNATRKGDIEEMQYAMRDERIALIKEAITVYQSELSKTNLLSYWRKQELLKAIDKKQKELDDYLKSVVKDDSGVRRSAFAVIARTLNINVDYVKLFVVLFINIVIEIMLVLTSWGKWKKKGKRKIISRKTQTINIDTVVGDKAIVKGLEKGKYQLRRIK